MVASPARAAALGKYLVATANSFDEKNGGRQGGGGPSAKRKRLHVLYLLHDVLYHTLKRHPGSDDFARAVEGHLAPLFLSVGAFSGAPKHTARTLDLLAFWEEVSLFGADMITHLRTLVEKASEDGAPPRNDTPQAAPPTSGKLQKEAPFTLPPTHGDPSLAWFDLPAANWLPHLTPNSTKPMKPDMIKPLQLAQGPADKAVVEAVKSLLTKVDRLFSKEDGWGEHADLNEMGERVVLDEVTGEVVGGETYYGWSRAFCKKMRDRHSKPQDQRGRSRSRSHSRSSSRSSTSHPYKRRRLSRSPSRSPDRNRRSRSPSGRRAQSRTPSPSRHRRERPFRRSPEPGNDTAAKPAFYPPPPMARQQMPQPVPPHQIPPPPPPYGYSGPWPPPLPPFPPGGIPQGWNGGPGGQGQFHGRGGYRGDYGRGRGRGW